MCSSTRWRKSWASSALRNTPWRSAWAEDGHRSAGRSQRRHAVGRMEDPQLQAEVVCRRDHFGGHRTGRRGHHAGAIDAGDRGDSSGWPAWCVPHVAAPRGLPPDCAGDRSLPGRRPRFRSIPTDWRSITDAMAGVVIRKARRPGARPGHRYRGKDRQRADLSNVAEGQDGRGRQGELQGQWLVCGIHAAAQSGHCGVQSVRRRRARQTGGPSGDPGDQGLRGQATPATDQGRELRQGGRRGGLE